MPHASSDRQPRFARAVFATAGAWGMLVIPALYFLPPPPGPPEVYYGFAGVALAWQIAFLIIATDPRRYRPLMAAAMVEKFAYALAVFRVAPVMPVLAFGTIDLLFGLLFLAAWRQSRSEA